MEIRFIADFPDTNWLVKLIEIIFRTLYVLTIFFYDDINA